MKRVCMFLSVVGVCATTAMAAQTGVSVVDQPETNRSNSFYIGNKAPLISTPFVKLPIRAIEPRGWLRKELELQAEGFHGHLEEISQFLKKEDNAWLNPSMGGHSGWEEVPYWLKGFSNCAYLLHNEEQIEKAEVWIEAALKSGRADGWFGPVSNLTRHNGAPDLWPNMIMQFCLQDYYDFTGDKRVIDLLSAYCKFLETIPEEKFLPGYWDKMRGGDLLFSVYWLYNRTGDKALLDLAKKVHRHTARWDEDVINWHNVNMGQAFGEAGTYYMQSKAKSDLQAPYRNWEKIRESYGQVPGGMFGGDENCRPGYTGPRQGVETCGIIEAMLSDEILLTITGDSLWADRCEDAAFNSLPAALTADIKALRYLTAPNQVLSDRQNKSPGVQNGGPMFLMNPHIHRCCQHNWGHGWPYFSEHLWLATPDDGLAAVFYMESAVTAKVDSGAEVTVAEHTHYPFDENVRLVIESETAVRFPLYLRVPGWCKGAKVSVNGQALDVDSRPGAYIRIEREWAERDLVELTLPMEVSLRRWEKNMDSVSVDRGPLTYSLKIGEKYVRQGGTDEWPAWEIYPTTPWNYGLVLDPKNPAKSFQVAVKEWPENDMPFTHEGVPIEMKAKGKRIPEWDLDSRGLVGKIQPSPVRSSEPVEDITLIPMGAARLRVSAFPVIGDGPDAHQWKAPAKPAFKVRASHCWGSDTVEAVADGVLPQNSNDHGIPRMTWWPRQGTNEWIEAQFDKPRDCRKVGVYWFDDTGNGGCRVPESWRLLYRRGDDWAPVETRGVFAVNKDRMNEVSFTPVKTQALRIEVKLQDKSSGGILEWAVE